MTEFYEQFNYNRYVSGSSTLMNNPGEQFLVNKGLRISFTRVASDEDKDLTIHFKSFITNYNETYMCQWETDKIYGRADGVPIFTGTKRKISLGLAIPAVNNGEAYENLAKVQQLIQFLYPSYRDKINDTALDYGVALQEAFSQIITRSPLIRLHFMNMIQDCELAVLTPEPTSATIAGSTSNAYIYNAYEMEQDGLMGIITNFIVLHHMGDNTGVIDKINTTTETAEDGTTTSTSEFKAMIPKLIEINFDFEPIHQHSLGWDTSGVFGGGRRAPDSGNLTRSTDRDIMFPFGVYLKPEVSYSNEVDDNASGPPSTTEDSLEGSPDDQRFEVGEPIEGTEPAEEDDDLDDEAGADAAIDSAAATDLTP